MKLVILFVVTLTVVSDLASGRGLSLERSAYVEKYLPLTEPEVLEKYKEYAYDLLQNQPFSQNELHVVNQFGIGQSLAVVNENVVLNVSSSGIEDVLKIGCHKITSAYRNLIRRLKEDPNMLISSTIYTQEQDVYLSPGLGKLITFVNLVDMTKDMKSYVDFINAEIQRKSTVKIPTQFFQTDLPSEQLGGEYLVNIINYQNSWPKAWTLMEEQAKFFSLNKTEPVQFMMTEGFYELIEKNNFILVRIPLPGGKKNLVLVKSNIHYVELLKSGKTPEDWAKLINKLWNRFVAAAADVKDNEWTRKYINIQIPVIKQVVGTSIISRLKEMGLNKTLCPTPEMTASAKTNFMEQFGQMNYIDFNTENLVLESITGTKNIGSNKQEEERHSIKRRSPEEDAPPNPIPIQSMQDTTPVGEPLQPYMAVFDQPFYWSLNDVNVGPLITGGVLAPSNDYNLPNNFMQQFLSCK